MKWYFMEVNITPKGIKKGHKCSGWSCAFKGKKRTAKKAALNYQGYQLSGRDYRVTFVNPQ